MHWRYILPIYIVSCTLVLSTTMAGSHVVGSDVQREFYVSNLALQCGWNPNWFGEMSNSSIVMGLIAPWIARILQIDLLWVFKLIIPLIYCTVPVILFYAFLKQIGKTKALFAVLFFMAVPMFFTEIPQMAKAMVAEVFLALMILFLLIDEKTYWNTLFPQCFASIISRKSWKIFAVSGCLLMSLMCHYTVGGIAIAYLLCVFGAMLVTKPFKLWGVLDRRKMGLIALVITLAVSIGGGWLYYTNVYQGKVLLALGFVGMYVGNMPEQVLIDSDIPSGDKNPTSTAPDVILQKDGDSGSVPSNVPGVSDGITAPHQDLMLPKNNNGKQLYLDKQPPLVRTGIGFDFMEVSIWGKLFRIIQIFTQVLIVAGFGWLLFKHRKYGFTAEFIACIVASFGLLFMCIFIPNFSRFINMTRFYHMSLFFLAPMFVLGVDAICRSGYSQES